MKDYYIYAKQHGALDMGEYFWIKIDDMDKLVEDAIKLGRREMLENLAGLGK